jgi:sugar phosphate isomerase/epimerase
VEVGREDRMIGTCFCTIAFQKNKWGRDRTVERPLGRIVPVVAAAGYDAIEIWGPHLEALSDNERADVGRLLIEAGLRVAMVSPYFDFTTSPETAARSVDSARRVLALARQLGSRAVRCFTGHVGSAEATADQWRRAVGSLRALADEGPDVLWALETHSRNLMDTVESGERLVGEVGRPNVRLILQPATFGAAYLEASRRLAGLSCHVHATNSRQGRRADLASGEMDWRAILALLDRAGFDGYVSVEWMGDDPEAAARREAPYLAALRDDLGGAGGGAAAQR